MKQPIDYLIERIAERLPTTGLSERQISINATGGPDALRNIRKNRSMPSADRLQKIARELHCTPSYLLGETDYRNDAIEKYEKSLPPKQEETQVARKVDTALDIPVYGTAIGTDRILDLLEDGQRAIEQTDLLNAEVIDHFRRTPSLARNRKLYGLYVAGASMEPAFESGSPIIIDPTRPPQIRDYVVVHLRDSQPDQDESTAAVLIKRLARRSASYIDLEQYNPAGVFRVPVEKVGAIHRVVPWGEVIGS